MTHSAELEPELAGTPMQTDEIAAFPETLGQEEPLVELVLHKASDKPVDESMDRRTILERMHEIMTRLPVTVADVESRLELRRQATQLALIGYGVLDNSPEQIARYTQLFPSIEVQANELPNSAVAGMFQELEAEDGNSVLDLFDDYRNRAISQPEADRMQRTAAFFMARLVET